MSVNRRVKTGGAYVTDPGGGPSQWQNTYENRPFDGSYVDDPGGGPDQWQYLDVSAVAPGDVPALAVWFKGDDGSGTALLDSADPTNTGFPLISNMTITKNAAGQDQWAAAGGFTSYAGAAANFTGANYGYQAAASAAMRTLLTTKSFMIEVDFTPTALISPVGYGHGTLFAIGRGSGAGADAGVRVGWSGTTGGQANGIRFQVAGQGGGGGSIGILLPGTVVAGTRHHAIFLMDRSVNGDEVDLFFNGTLADSRVTATVPGTITHSSTSSYWRAALCYNANNDADPISATIHNARVWTFAGAPPANIADIIADLAASPDSLPASVSGLL